MVDAPEGASLAVDCRCILGEGPVWCERRRALFWTDIEGSRLWMLAPDAPSTRSWTLPDRLGSFAWCRSGKLLLGLAKSLAIADLDAALQSGIDEIAVTTLLAVEPDLPTRINDGRADRAGHFVFGTLAEDFRSPLGSFYQYSSRHGLRRLELDRVIIANSIGFSPDGGTMYFCDSPLKRIMQCDYDADAARATNARVFADLSSHPGFPDGSAVDAEGRLWNAEWGAGVIRAYSPDGVVEREVNVPVKNPSCAAFGGANLQDLYITSSRQQMKPAELEAMPAAGGLFRAAPAGTHGLPEPTFNE